MLVEIEIIQCLSPYGASPDRILSNSHVGTVSRQHLPGPGFASGQLGSPFPVFRLPAYSSLADTFKTKHEFEYDI